MQVAVVQSAGLLKRSRPRVALYSRLCHCWIEGSFDPPPTPTPLRGVTCKGLVEKSPAGKAYVVV
jgi:hypothetical protein